MPTKWIVLLAIFLSAELYAATEDTAKVMFLRGTATATDPKSELPRPLKKNSLLEAGDIVETGPKGLMKIVFPDKSIIFLKSSSKIKIKEMNFVENKPEDDAMVTDVLKGGLRALTGAVGKRNPEKTKYNTAVSTIGIRGTAIRLDEQDDNSWSVIFDIGEGYAKNEAGTVDIGLDQSLNLKSANAIGKPVKTDQDPNDPAQLARYMSNMSPDEISRFVASACNGLDESRAMMLTSMQSQLSSTANKSLVATTQALSKCLEPEVMSKVLSFDAMIKAEIADQLLAASLDGGLDVETATESVMVGMQNDNPDVTKKVFGIAVNRGLSLDQASRIRSRVGNICL